MLPRFAFIRRLAIAALLAALASGFIASPGLAGDRKTRAIAMKSSGAVTASNAQTTGFDVSAYFEGQILISVTAESGSSTLTHTVQTSDDNSTYYDHTDGSSITATGRYRTAIANFGKFIRVNYTVTGTSFTFAIIGVFKN